MMILRTFLILVLLCSSVCAQSEFVEVTSPATQPLKAIDFADALTGFAAGDGGTILKTSDGGITWVELTTPSSKNLWGLKVVSSNRVIAAGDDGTVLLTTDNGSTWTIQPTPIGTQEFLFGVQVYDQSTIYISGGRFDGGSPMGTVIRSTDAGLTWSIVGDANQAFFLDRIHFLTPELGIAVGASASFTGVIVRTTDGGQTWTTVHEAPSVIAGLSVFDSEHILATGSGGSIRRSTNAGLDWESQQSASTGDLLGVTHVSPDHALIAGDMILETTNGGELWERQTTPGQTVYNAVVHIAGSGTVIAVGSDGSIVRRSAQANVDHQSKAAQHIVYSADSHTLLVKQGGIVEVYDLLGVSRLQTEVNARERIGVGALVRGMYTVVLTSGNLMEKTKIMIR